MLSMGSFFHDMVHVDTTWMLIFPKRSAESTVFQWKVKVDSPLEHIQLRGLRFFNLFENDKSKDWKVSNDRSRRFPLQLSSGDIFGSEKM